MGHDTQIEAAYDSKTNTYNYNKCFDYIKDELAYGDIAIANLEVTLAGEPYKGYPQFSSPKELAISAKNAGFKVFVSANNHACDSHKKGILKTIETLDELGIKRCGTYKDSVDFAKNYPLIINQNGFKLAILNYTYGTNGIKIPIGTIVNHIDTSQIASHIIQAKAHQPDQIIVFLHWGDEYQTTPSTSQVALKNFLRSKGIEIIIGSHPHVLQPMEWNRNINENYLVAYSLGNFLSGQRTAPRDGAAILRIELTKDNQHTVITDAKYLLTYVLNPFIDGKRQFVIIPVSRAENDVNFTPPGGWGWGRMADFALEAREILGNNTNVSDLVYLPK